MDTRLSKLILILLLGLGSFSAITVLADDTCITDGLTVCFDVNQNQYKTEAHAHLVMVVPDEAYGQAVEDFWDWYHPDLAGRVTTVIAAEATGTEDVFYLNQNQAALLYASLYPMHDVLSKNIVLKQAGVINATDLRYLPISAEGFAMIVNTTRLELAGIDITDADDDGRIDSLASFEQILALAPVWETMNVNAFPLALNEPYALYPFLTAGGFELFSSLDATQPGFDDPSVRSGLRLIEALSTVNWNHSETNDADTYTWRYEDALVNDDFGISLVGSWMQVQGYDHDHMTDWRITPFPTFEGQALRPMIRTSGLAIHANTYYPSAAHELIRILKSVKGLQVLIDTTERIPLTDVKTLNYLNFPSVHTREFALAFQSAISEPLIAFKANPTILAMDVYTHMNVSGPIADLWNGTIGAAEAQTRLILSAQSTMESLLSPQNP
jgi:arabinogalactan oligomer / maltooligosaccharide transport system substrate-binding protein